MRGRSFLRFVLPLLVPISLTAPAFAQTAVVPEAPAEAEAQPIVLDGVVGVRSVAVGGHTCAVSHRGNVYCWGYNGYGEIGDGTTDSRAQPTRVVNLRGEFAQVAVGYRHSCALNIHGVVYCWGDNTEGQLGDGTFTGSPVPVRVTVLRRNVSSIASGEMHTCAITNSGVAWCWGRNSDAQLGDGSTASRNRPVRVLGIPGAVLAIAPAARHSCALNDAGRIYCWGYNGYGQLGDGTGTDRQTAAFVSGLGGGNRAITAAGYFSCAVNQRRLVFCWGANDSGQFGNGTTTDSRIPTRSHMPRGATAITAGAGYYYNSRGSVCALNRNGIASCWGENRNGQLGIGSTFDAYEPARVLLLGQDVLHIDGSAGGEHACAIQRAGRLYCWGENYYGQVGDGTQIGTVAPTRVLGRLHQR